MFIPEKSSFQNASRFEQRIVVPLRVPCGESEIYVRRANHSLLLYYAANCCIVVNSIVASFVWGANIDKKSHHPTKWVLWGALFAFRRGHVRWELALMKDYAKCYDFFWVHPLYSRNQE